LRDEQLKPEIQRVFKENFCVYGAHKLWKQLKREGELWRGAQSRG